MNRRRWVLLGCVVAAFFVYVVARGAHRGNDFKYPYGAAQALWRTSQLHVAAQPRYPISFHVLLSPLASLPILLASAIWAGLSFAAVALLPGQIQRLTGLSPRAQAWSWVVVAPCIVDALVLGQSDPLNLLLVVAGLAAVERGHLMPGVGLVGAAGMIKILPIVHWATIVARCRSVRVWAAMVLTALFGVALLIAAVGWNGAADGIREQFVWISNYEKPWHLVARGSDLRANNESLPIVLARTFCDLGPVRPRHALALGVVPLEAAWWMWEMILATLIVAWLGCAHHARALPPSRAALGMFALTSIGMLAATPICWHHYFLWLLPAALFLADRRRVLMVAAVISTTTTAVPVARSLGCQMLLALGFFALVAHDLVAEAASARVEEGLAPGPGPLPASLESVPVVAHFAAGFAGSNSTMK